MQCILTSDQASRKNNEVRSWKSSINCWYTKCLFFFCLIFKTQPWMLIYILEFHESQNWPFCYSHKARYLKEQKNGCRDGGKTGRGADKAAAFLLGKTLHFGGVQKGGSPYWEGSLSWAKPCHLRVTLLNHFYILKMRKECCNDRQLRTLDCEFDIGRTSFSFCVIEGFTISQKYLSLQKYFYCSSLVQKANCCILSCSEGSHFPALLGFYKHSSE